MNKLGDEPKPPKTDEPPQPDARCLTRLPVTADLLCKELGLPPGAITAEDMRNDKTGFRAAMYRDEVTGKLILVGRDTQPTSLADWQTNTRNGDGKDTDQYVAMRELSGALADQGLDFDFAGYSKAGGFAQEGRLRSKRGRAFLFNSAGTPDAALRRTGNVDFSELEENTVAFSSEGDFLTYMNETTSPEQQIANTKFLRNELSGQNRKYINPMRIDHRNPQTLGAVDKTFDRDLAAYMHELDEKIAAMEADHSAGKTIRAFPPVRAGRKEVVPNSMGTIGKLTGATSDGPGLGKLAQHQMDNVMNGLKDTYKQDKKALEDFVKSCG